MVWVLAGVGGLLLLIVVVVVILVATRSNDPAQAGAGPPGARGGNTPNPLPRPVAAISDPEAARIYLSDLGEFDVRPLPFSWHFGKNGVLGEGTGRFKVNGWESSKGLSSHPEKGDYAGASYSLPPADVFECLMGLADSAGNRSGGPVVFEVLGDHKVLWRSQGVSKPGQYQDCRVSVKGVKILELRAYAPPGDDLRGTHVVWIDPYVTRPGMGKDVAALAPFTPLVRQGEKVFLSDLPEYAVLNGPWPFTKNGRIGDPGNSKIIVDGRESPKGLSMHPGGGEYTRARYRLGGKATLFESQVAINEGSRGAWAPAVFEVHGDGRLLWRSLPTKSKTPIACMVDLSGVQELELRTRLHGGLHNECHAVWVDPFIWCSSAKDLPKSE